MVTSVARVEMDAITKSTSCLFFYRACIIAITGWSQARRIGGTRGTHLSQHDRIAAKDRCRIHRRLSHDATDRTELAVTANNGRRSHKPLSSEAAARLLPSDARCRVQSRSAPLGRSRLHSAATATESARLYYSLRTVPSRCSRNPRYSLWSPRKGEYKR